MKKISEIVNQKDPTQLTSWSPTKKDYKQHRPEVIIHLFAAMLVKYGHKWSSYIGDDEEGQQAIENEWAMQLGKFNLSTVKTSLDSVIDEFPDWPPTVGEFKSLCKVGDRSWETRKSILAIDNPTKPETFKTNIEQMKEMLK